MIQKFEDVCQELIALQNKKGTDYGKKTDPLANLRGSEEFGVPSWVGSIMRGNDKMRRIQSFVTNGRLVNESLEDAIMDLAVYAIHALRLYRESKEQPNAETP